MTSGFNIDNAAPFGGLSRRINNIFISIIEELRKYIQTYKMHNKIKHIKYFSRFVYDQLGLKKIVVIAAVLSVYLFSPIPAMAAKVLKETKVPDALIQELDHLLTLASPDSKNTFDLRRIEKVLDFVASPKSSSALYYADKKFGANSAYYEFDIQSDLNHILRYAFNPEIPSYTYMPSSVRLSYWSEVNGHKQPLPKLWDSLPNPDSPVIVKGVEHIEITPDLFSGAYYRYDMDKTLILCNYQGRNLLISISKQKDKSDVGKKGIILGKDEGWNYFYSGKKGVTKTGIGWAKSYIYDSFSVSFYYEVNEKSPRVRCGIFKWLRAGWANLNLVKKKHIHKGLERCSKDFKTILEHPSLPQDSELARVFSNYNKLSHDDLKKKVKPHLKVIESLIDNEKPRFKSFAEPLKNDRYLNQMTRQEMQAILVLEYVKSISSLEN